MRHFFVAGFDFGTSYSKVVLRDQLTGVAKVVTFGSSGGLFPSFVSIAKSSVIGPNGAPERLRLSYPKLIAADVASNRRDFSSLYGNLEIVHALLGTTSLEQIATFSLVRFFLSVLDSIHEFIGNDDEWNTFNAEADPLVVQLAVPTGLTTSDGKTDAMMQRSLLAATLIRSRRSQASPVSSVEELTSALATLDQLDVGTRENLTARCITYPEVAAGVQTVLRSPNTPDGKYITLDVGAGTVDLNAFYRRSSARNNNSGLDYWACEVRPLGFARLHRTHNAGDGSSSHEVTVNPLPQDELLKRLTTSVDQLMHEAFRYQPRQVHGDAGSPWDANTIAYIWGGGAAHRPFEDTFFAALQSLGIGVRGINRLPAPIDRLRLPDAVDFGRLAVAYGLSFHKLNLEAVRLPHQLRTFDDLYPDYWQDVIDAKKQCNCRANLTCSRCFGTGFISPDEKIAPLPVIPSTATNSAISKPKEKTRIETALEHCLHRFELMIRREDRVFLVERLLLLNRIRLLSSRPGFSEHDPLIQQARESLLYNVRLFGGKVRVRRLSATRTDNGCWCLVLRHSPEPPADVEIYSDDPVELENRVNCDAPRRHVDLGCGIQRTDRREFVLEVTSLNPRTRYRNRRDWRAHRHHA